VRRCGALDRAELLRKPPIPPFRFEIIVDTLRVARSIFCSIGGRFPSNQIVVCPAQNVIDRSSFGLAASSSAPGSQSNRNVRSHQKQTWTQ
jgi:hypothetical protein